MAESAIGSEQPETPETETSLSDSLSQCLEQLHREMASALETAGQEAVREVLAAVAAIDGARSQADVLAALLEGASRFAGRAAFFLTRPEGVRGWAAQGFGRRGSALEGLDLDYGDGAWAALAEGAGAVRLSADDCADLSGRIDADPGAEGVLIPFALRGQLGGALYADRRKGDTHLGVAGLQLLTHSAAQALETLAVRDRVSPTLRGFDAAGATALPLWQESAYVELEEAEVAKPEPEVSVPEPEASVPEPEESVPEPEVSAPAAPESEEPEPAAPAEELPAKELAAEEPAPEPEMAAVPEPETPEGEALAEEPAAGAGLPSDAAVDFGFETSEPREEELAEEPEPELEHTSIDIWALEEDEEPTQVGLEAPDTAAVEVPAAPESGGGVPAEAVGQQTVRLDIATLQGQQPGAPPPVQEFRPPEEPVPAEPTPAESIEPPVVEPPPIEPAPVEEDEEPTIISSQPLAGAEYAPAASAPEPPAAAPEPAASDAGLAPPAEARPEPAGGSQVLPPTDLQGPGSAFTQAASAGEIEEGDEALHEEARRLARLLVSEIKLYNEEIIEEGQRNSDIYDRLKDDIDRSRQMYQERIDPRLHGKEDYFHLELVQRLAGGNESLLGI